MIKRLAPLRNADEALARLSLANVASLRLVPSRSGRLHAILLCESDLRQVDRLIGVEALRARERPREELPGDDREERRE